MKAEWKSPRGVIPEPCQIIDRGSAGVVVQINNLRVIATWDQDWDSLEISTKGRCPTMEEVQFVREFFLDPTVLCSILLWPRGEESQDTQTVVLWASQKKFPRELLPPPSRRPS